MTVVVSGSLIGFPSSQTRAAKTNANSRLKRGPESATKIFPHGETTGRECACSFLVGSTEAICGMETNPPAGMQPTLYSTPATVFLHKAGPNQMENLS